MGVERWGVPLLEDVSEAAAELRAAQTQVETARAKLYARVRAAHSEGISAAAIARAAGLSPERVRQIVKS